MLGAIALSVCLTACGGAPSGGSDGVSTGQTQAANGAIPGEDDSIKIDEIEWSVGENVISGNRMLSLSYTNNSPFTILEFDIEFTQREDVTDEQRSVFDEIYADPDWAPDETPEELYITSYNYHYVPAGQKADPIPCSIQGITSPTMDQYDLMEPSIARIKYVGGDGKVYTEFYDFLNDSYSLEEGYTEDVITEWPDNELAKLIPEIEAPTVLKAYESDGYYSIEAFGLELDSFDAYVSTCKDAGFNVIDYESETTYRAQNEDGYEIDVSYNEYSDSVHISIDAPES